MTAAGRCGRIQHRFRRGIPRRWPEGTQQNRVLQVHTQREALRPLIQLATGGGQVVPKAWGQTARCQLPMVSLLPICLLLSISRHDRNSYKQVKLTQRLKWKIDKMVCSFSFRGIYFNKFKPYQILFYFVGFFRNFVLLAFLTRCPPCRERRQQRLWSLRWVLRCHIT